MQPKAKCVNTSLSQLKEEQLHTRNTVWVHRVLPETWVPDKRGPGLVHWANKWRCQGFLFAQATGDAQRNPSI